MTLLAAAPRPGSVTPVDRLRAAESYLVFAVSFAILFALGLWIVVDLHVIYSDGQTRLAHAYIVWWGRPSKLSAMGFVWPPAQTLALLPFALIKPLATSLVALPLFAALCGAGLLTIANRTLGLVGLQAAWRYPLLAAFAANPLFLDYSTNGMAEILFMVLLMAGLHYFVSWYLGGGLSYRKLAVSGLFMSLAFMARYELGASIALMAVLIAVLRWPVRRRLSDIEAPLLIFLAPTAYLAVVWSVISMMIVGGGPFSWLSRAGDQSQGARIAHPDALHQLGTVLKLTTEISPLLWLAPAALLVLAVVHRDRFSAGLALLIVIGAATTLVIVIGRPYTGLLQPRYNIRTLAPMLVGTGWFLGALTPGWRRNLAGVVALGSLLAAIPLSLHLMRTFPYQYEEQAYARALTTGKDQTGTRSVGGYVIGNQSNDTVARWINAHVHRDGSVLIDDAAFPGLILTSGRPGLFQTRITRGDKAWHRILDHPWGRVRYLVVSPTPAYAGDLIITRYPTAYSGGLADTRVVLRTSQAAVVELLPR